MGTEITLKSNDEIIKEAHHSGELHDALDTMATDDLLKLKLEVIRGELVAELIDSGADKLIEAAKRLGWGDRLRECVEEM
ncbi:MAG: hypothetical protein ACW99G_01510 [Candidatus Thorarchaeota archaeon]